MRIEEFLARMAQYVSQLSYEAVGIDMMVSSQGDQFWWITITAPISDYSAERKSRRIAGFRITDGLMTDIKPLGDAAVRDWQKVEAAIR